MMNEKWLRCVQCSALLRWMQDVDSDKHRSTVGLSGAAVENAGRRGQLSFDHHLSTLR